MNAVLRRDASEKDALDVLGSGGLQTTSDESDGECEVGAGRARGGVEQLS